MSDGPTDTISEKLQYSRRTIMGALAAGAGISAVGMQASAQEDDEEQAEEDAWLPPEASEAHAAVLTGGQANVETDAGGCAKVTPIAENTLMVDLVLEDIECVTQAHIHEGSREEDGPVVAPLLEYTAEPDGTGSGGPLTTGPDMPLIAGATVEDPDLVEAILTNPEQYYVNVHTSHNPGGEIRGQIRGFDLGQETEIQSQPAQFLVSNLEPVDVTVTAGDLITVSARISNNGDATATQTVEFRLDGDVLAEQSVELGCRKSTTVTFEDIDTTDLEASEYEHGIFTDDDSQTGTLAIEEPEPAEFLVSNLDPVDVTVIQGEIIDVTADVENAGELPGSQTIEFRVEGDPLAEQELDLDPGQTESVTFADIDTSPLDPGDYEHGVFTEDDSETGILTVEAPPEPAEFAVSGLDPMDVTVTQGDIIDVSATVDNVGEETGTQSIEFRVDGDPLADQELELNGGQSEVVTFADIDTSPLEPGDYEHGVFSEDDSQTATLTVEEEVEETAEFTVSDLEPVDVQVTRGSLIDVFATIQNTGQVAGTQVIEFRLDGDPLFEEELELEVDESEQVMFPNIDTDELELRDYVHGVFSEDDSETGTLTIIDPDDPDDNDDPDDPDDNDDPDDPNDNDDPDDPNDNDDPDDPDDND